MIQKVTLVVLLVFSIAGALAFGQSSAPSEDQTRSDNQRLKFDEAEVLKLIGQLKSLEYGKRVNASRQLVALGDQVIEPLFEAIRSNDLELSFRATKIIREIGLNSDLDTLELIILRSRNLPGAFQPQFDEWSSKAISKWKANQSKIAVNKLAAQGATILESDSLGQLGLMFIEDLENQAKPLKEVPKLDTDAVLQQLRDLKKELSGEVVLDKPRKVEKPKLERVEIVDAGGRRLIVRGGELVARNVDPQFNPRNVKIDSQWQGQSKDLNQLRFVSNLNQVEFVEQEITAEILAELKKIRKLRSLLLTRCKFSFTELQKFKREKDRYYPLQLMATGAGYLGVYGPNSGEPDDGNGSYVSLVSPNSAASEAGLERGDMIVKVDDDSIRSFADLSLVISSKPVGKEIRIAIRRDEKEQVLTAKLKSREGLR